MPASTGLELRDLTTGTGEIGELIACRDWSATSLGPPAAWPQSLKVILRILLTSRYPMFVWWGPELIHFYNETYARMTLGAKHPWALGRSAREVWAEVWPEVAPRVDSVFRTGEATWDEDLLLLLERRGFPEESYHTFSYSPIPDDAGGVGGLFCAVVEETQRILGERQLALLSDLGTRTATGRTWEEVCGLAAASLATNSRDLPFAMIYLFDPEAQRMVLAGSAGIDRGHPAAPAQVPVEDESLWPFAQAMRSQQILEVQLGDIEVPRGPWPRPPHQAAALPIVPSGQTGKAGVLIIGLNPFRLFDDYYKGFLQLAAGQIAASITQSLAYEEEKRRAEALAEIDRAKTEFFSNVSHEFRTPLTLILGPTEEMLAGSAGELTGGQRVRLESLRRNGVRLQKLVNTLLDFTRAGAGRLQARFEPVDLAELTRELAASFDSEIERAGLQLRVDAPPLDEPAYVDRDLWEKIVLNLLSNALKFTFQGEIEVSLHTGEGQIVLRVRDTGVGIPEEELPRLFERFHRVRGTLARTHEGSGIGLALVRELVELHGGQVGVESTPGVGSIFTVTIPQGTAHLPAELLAAASAAPAESRTVPFVEEARRWLPDGDETVSRIVPRASGKAGQEGAAGRILLADDNADMRDYVRRLLAPYWQVETVVDGLQALTAARANPPDLLLSDIMMPHLDGLGLLRELRSDPRTATIPVILLSARAGDEARAAGMEAWADDYLVKPFSPRELLARVRSHLELGRLRREAEQALREADRRKDEFLATLAHELRNPLAPIRNSLHVLRLSQESTPVAERVLDMLERQVGQMARLVDDLMEVSRITRGKVELRRERIELAAVVRSAVETSRPLIEEAGHQLTVELPREPVILDADALRLAQVFANLLNNAAKYTDPGGRIRLSAEKREGGVAVSIRDTGMGIPEEVLPRIFEMFEQADRASERAGRDQGGLGIGLTLVRSLVELHGGRVEARSEGPGTGSEFVVHLPLAAPLEQADPGETDEERTDRLPRCRVLVVDDNRDSADSLGMLLELLGAETRIAYDGSEALEILPLFRPDVALLDLGMPGMDGYEVARRIREQPAAPGVRLIALTGWGQEEDRRRSREAGFDHHLTKPADLQALQTLLAAEGCG